MSAFQEVVEAEGHLIDSHIMEHIFDKVVEHHGRFEVEQFRIGRTNSEPSYLRLKVETPDARVAGAAAARRCSSSAARRSIPATRAAARSSATAARRRISTPPPITARYVRIGQQWIEVENQRMDAHDRGRRRARVLPPAARSARGRPDRGRACAASASFRNRRSATGWRSRSCRTASRRSGRWRPRCGRRRRWCGTRIEQKQKVVVVAGPVVVHTGGVAGLAELIRGGWVQALLSGNALGVHDIEAALFGTSLGVRLTDGRQEEHGHRNHMRAINAIYHAAVGAAGGGMRPADVAASCTSA